MREVGVQSRVSTHLIVNLAVHLTVAAGATLLGREWVCEVPTSFPRFCHPSYAGSAAYLQYPGFPQVPEPLQVAGSLGVLGDSREDTAGLTSLPLPKYLLRLVLMGAVAGKHLELFGPSL